VIPVLEEALAEMRPVLINFHADPNVIALPPHVTLEQTRKFFSALAEGDPDRTAVLHQLYEQLRVQKC
jgi:pyruvate dehydrogenase (quinone)